MTYNLKKMVATASVAALMFGAASTAGAVEFSNVTPQGLTPASQLDVASDPFVDLYSFDLLAGAGLVYPDGNVVFTITAPGNATFTSVSAANVPGSSVSNASLNSAGTVASFTVLGIDGDSSVSFADLSIELDSCAGTTGVLTATAIDDNGAGSPVGATAIFGNTTPTEPQLVNACVPALTFNVASDELVEDTLVLESDGTLSPSGNVGSINFAVNPDAIINGDEDPLTAECLDAVNFELSLGIGNPNGIGYADIALRRSFAAPFGSLGVAPVSVSGTDLIDLINVSLDDIVLVEDSDPITEIAESSVSVGSAVVTYNGSCATFETTTFLAPTNGGVLDTLDTPGTETFGVYDWVGGAATLTPSIWRVVAANPAQQLADVAIPLTVTLSNASPASANGDYEGMVTPVEGQIIIDSRDFGIPGLDFDVANVELAFQSSDDTTTVELDVDRYIVTVGGGITAFADGANDILPTGPGVPATGVTDPADDPFNR